MHYCTICAEATYENRWLYTMFDIIEMLKQPDSLLVDGINANGETILTPVLGLSPAKEASCYTVVARVVRGLTYSMATRTSSDSYFVKLGGELVAVTQLKEGATILMHPYMNALTPGVVLSISVDQIRTMWALEVDYKTPYYIKDGFVVPSNNILQLANMR